MSSVSRSVAQVLRVASGAAALGTLCALSAPAHAGEPSTTESGGLEEIIITAQYREENLQVAPLAITALSGDMLDERGLTNVVDLGLAVPNAQMRQSPGQWGPNSTIGLRGVGQMEFIYTAEPGVGVYVDDVYLGTLTGSNLDLLDLERAEVLRGPQGTLFGKNSLGGAIRMVSKAPQGDDTGYLEATVGSSNRVDFKGSFDMALVPEKLFLRVSGVSKAIDGYQNRLDFTCQMIANGTPELAGTLPQQVASNATNTGDCKIGENGGSESHAVRGMLRFLPTDNLDLNLVADYSKTVADPVPEVLLHRSNPGVGPFSEGALDANVYIPTFGISHTTDDRFLSTRDFNYATYSDPVSGRRWPTDQTSEAWSASFKGIYTFNDSLSATLIAAYRTYDIEWASDGDLTPLDSDTATTLNLQTHDQTSVELRFSGQLLSDRLDWTAGAYYYDDSSDLGGFVSLPAFALLFGPGFAQNDRFTTESQSAFAHTVLHFTDSLSATLGARYTDESKTYAFDHTGFLTIPTPLEYGGSHFDWKASLDYQFTEGTMAYVMASTGFRSEGANPRPFTAVQLTAFSGEEILAYEAGLKTDLFDRTLRVNFAAFINDYDPRLVGAFGLQCDAAQPTQPYRGVGVCPAGTDFAGSTGLPWFDQQPSSGQGKGAEVELTWTPIDFLAINGSVGYYEFDSDAKTPTDLGYIAPDTYTEPKYTGSLGAQYSFVTSGGSSFVPRLDWFYQGKRSSGNPSQPQLPENWVPSYKLMNARLSYFSSDGAWTVSAAADNLLDEDYWVQLSAVTNQLDGTEVGPRKGTPGRGREVSLSIRRNFQ